MGMRKGSDIIGKPIVSFDTGDRFGTVKDLIFDQGTDQLLALLVEEAGIFSSARVVSFSDVKAIGPDVVIVPSQNSIVHASKMPDVQKLLQRNNILKGTQILTTDGQNLGRMVDLYFSDRSGSIEGYEVSGGLFADAYTGRSYVPAPHTLKIGEDYAFVPPETAELMEEQVGGLKAAMIAATEKVQSAAQTTSDTIQSATETAGNRLQEAGRLAIASATNAVVDPAEQKAFVIGKTAQQSVAIDGVIVVTEGQIITPTFATIAEERGILDELYRAAGGDVVQKATEHIQGTAQATGERLQSAAQSANERLQTTVVQASGKLEALRQEAKTSVTNAVISPADQQAFALGKTAEWTVAAPDGTLIAMAGQIVTPAMAESAAQWDMTDELFRATGGQLTDEAARKASGLVAGYTVEQAQGRRVQRIVRTRSGIIIAASGQIVTDRVIEQAKTFHKEAELLEAVGLSARDAARLTANDQLAIAGDRVSSATGTVNQQLSQGTGQLKEVARSLWDQLRGTAGDLQERSNQAIEERRIRGALGRPVTRVILDRNDDVLLNVGDLITHHAIAAARREEVLDILLDSVYSETPKISEQDLRAPQVGSASLEVAHGAAH